MSKQCPVCETISHSAANHCSRCGVELPDKELSENDKLRIELHETKRDLQYYKKSLDEANVSFNDLKGQCKNFSEIIKQLETEKLKTIVKEKQLSDLIIQLKNTKNQKKNNSWGWGLTLLLFVSILIGVLYSNYTSQKIRIDQIDLENNQLRSERNSNTGKIQAVNENLTFKVEKQKVEIARLKEQAPQEYKVISDNAIIYSNFNDTYESTIYSYTIDTNVTIYMQKEGYGLMNYGWIKMSDLEKTE